MSTCVKLEAVFMMVGVFAKSSSAPSRRSKNFLDVDRAGSKSRISPAAGVQGEKPCYDSFQAVEVPEEPVEQDQPMPCPRPEPSIMEDGILWKAKIMESLRRRNDILAANMKPRECVVRGGSIPNPRRCHSRSMGDSSFLLEAHSAPEFEVKKLLHE